MSPGNFKTSTLKYSTNFIQKHAFSVFGKEKIIKTNHKKIYTTNKKSKKHGLMKTVKLQEGILI